MKPDILSSGRLWTRDFILLNLANLLMFTAFYFLIPTLPVFVTEVLGGKKSTVGIVLSVYTLAALLMRPLTGTSIDSLGRKTIYLIAFICFSLMFNLYLLAGSLAFLIGIRFLHGLAWGVTTTSGNTAVVDIIPAARRGEGISFFGMSFTLAMAIGPMLGIWICGDGHYEWLFISAFLLSLAGWTLAMFVRYPAFPRKKIRSLRLSHVFEKTSIPASLNIILINATYGGVITYIALYSKEIGVGSTGAYFLIFAFGVLLTRFRAGLLFDRYGPRGLMIFGLLCMSVSFPMLALVHNTAGFYASAFLLGLGGGVVGPCLQTMVNNMVESNRRGAATSTLFTALDLGIGLGMVVFGYLAEFIGMPASFVICGALNLTALLHYLTHVQGHYVRNKLIGI